MPALTKAIAATMADLADHRVVVDHRVHAYQRIALHDAAMQDRGVADMAILLDDGIGARKSVHDAAVLDIRAGAHLEAAEIAAQRSQWPDIAPRADDDVADEHGAGMHECAGDRRPV